MSYIILAHVATGDLATAALHNTLLDDIAIIKSNINDDGFLNPIRRLKSGNGATAANASASTLDSIVLPVLTALDFIHVQYAVSVTGGGSGALTGSNNLTLYHATDAAHIIQLITGTFNEESASGEVWLSQDQVGNTKLDANAVSYSTIQGTFSLGTRYSATATWVSGWTLGFRQGINLTGSGVLHWRWTATLYPGQ